MVARQVFQDACGILSKRLTNGLDRCDPLCLVCDDMYKDITIFGVTSPEDHWHAKKDALDGFDQRVIIFAIGVFFMRPQVCMCSRAGQ